jgi:hypothetical protein
MLSFTKVAIVFGITASMASAQLSGLEDLSTSCINTLLAVVNNPEASSCLNAAGLIGVITTPTNSSYVPKVDSWVSGVCAVPACSSSLIGALSKNVTTGCTNDSKKAAVQFTKSVMQYYPTVRRISCLKDTNKQYCITNELKAIETALGQPLSIDTAEWALEGTINFNNATAVPKDVVCGPCSQATYNIIKTEQPDLIPNSGFVDAGLKLKCGQAFVSGVPSSVTDPGVTYPSSNGKSGAVALVPFGGFVHAFGIAFASAVVGSAIAFL